jgi:hypothetical protein
MGESNGWLERAAHTKPLFYALVALKKVGVNKKTIYSGRNNATGMAYRITGQPANQMALSRNWKA